ncbi:MAG TPA: hypothetical protein VH325_10695 [Bryobacteraceae bacterium]|nr:hypothetical protein [Bryobacteraceae bacterium]
MPCKLGRLGDADKPLLLFPKMKNEYEARLIIPDVHHKVVAVDRIRRSHPGIPAIFLGDYFDDFYDTAADMEVTCRWLKQAIENDQDTFLLGNHCFAYLSYELGVRWGYCSGWDLSKQQIFHRHFPGDTLLKSSTWVAQCQGWVISHAGITRKVYRSFAKHNSSRQLAQNGPAVAARVPDTVLAARRALCAFEELAEWVGNAERALTMGITHPAFLAGVDRGGPARAGGILWCDWNTFEPVKGMRQIVGHTPADEVRYNRGDVCLDTHLHHYGFLKDGGLTIMKTE